MTDCASQILTMQLSSDVTLVAFDVLMDFVGLYEYVKRDSKVSVTQCRWYMVH